MLEINALLSGRKRDVLIPEGVVKYFKIWRALAKKHGKKDFDLESFVAGYNIGNNTILKEKILNVIYTENEIKDVFYDQPQ